MKRSCGEPPPYHCDVCGYEVEPAARCPECGTGLPDRLTYLRRARRRVDWLLMAVIGGWVVVTVILTVWGLGTL